jgi:cyclic dehypoxanthinyl futalosine synthase
VARCKFCAFYRPVGSAEGYTLGFDEVFRKIDETIALGGGQLLLQGGHNPDVPLAWYEDLFRAVKARYPGDEYCGQKSQFPTAVCLPRWP